MLKLTDGITAQAKGENYERVVYSGVTGHAKG